MEIIKLVLLDQNFLGAFIQSVLLIVIGYVLYKIKVFSEKDKPAFTALGWKIAAPCMAFDAFMTEFNRDVFMSQIGVFIITLVLYLGTLVVVKFAFRKAGPRESSAYGLLVAVGQLTLFAFPMLQSIYADSDSTVILSLGVMGIPFRIMIYIVSIISLSGVKLDKENFAKSIKDICINPSIIAMILGLIIWVTQGVMPQTEVNGTMYSVLRFDMTIPYVYKIVKTLKNILTPVCLILVGISLGPAKPKEVIKDKRAWMLSGLRMFVAPALTMLILIALQITGIVHFGEGEVMALVISFAAPTSATIGIYCIQYKAAEDVAAKTCFLSTIMVLVGIPLFYALTKVLLLSPIYS